MTKTLIDELQLIEKNIYLNRIRSNRSLRPLEKNSKEGGDLS
jgi:hypothetical protein